MFLRKTLPYWILQLVFILQQDHGSNSSFITSPNGYSYTSYQKGIVCNPTYNPIKPKTIHDLQQIVGHALLKNLTVKAIGNLNSITDIICTDGIPINMEKINHISYDREKGLATVGAGSTLEHLTTQLHRVGRALEGMPAFSGITIGGALGTGAHGSSLKLRTTISSQIEELTIVDGLGAIRNISRNENGQLFLAFRTHLGLLGIIYQVTIRTVAQYKVKISNKILPEAVLFEELHRLKNQARSSDFFQFFWFPTAKEVVVSKSLINTDADANQDCEVHFLPDVSRWKTGIFKTLLELFQKYNVEFGLYLLELFNMKSLVQPILGKTPLFLQQNSKGEENCNPAVGFSHKIPANKCNDCPWDAEDNSISFDESSIIIPLSELSPALEIIRSILREHPTQFYLNGIYFRFIIPSFNDSLAFEGNQEAVAIEWVHATRLDRFNDARAGLEVTQTLLQTLVHKHHGRAHWGKNGLYFSSPKMIRLQYGENTLKKYVNAMEFLDPHGIFLNDFGRRIRFGLETMTLEPQALEHCALGDHCVCKNDLDCGKENGYRFCSKLAKEFNVCNRKAGWFGSIIFIWVNHSLIAVFQVVRSYGLIKLAVFTAFVVALIVKVLCTYRKRKCSSNNENLKSHDDFPE
ncbi:unnamed protein product [Orchesella dallaii]|uniref:FAD-binding PCMH-type domain-containing protein n=1 Tax=Orchesella dallaii TaxID=48710 RepID=A0ABP1RDD6_9HEXA